MRAPLALESRKTVSELETKLRAILQQLQEAQDLSFEYPNTYVGIPSRITKAIIQAERWTLVALTDVVAVDVNRERGGDDKTYRHFRDRATDAEAPEK